MPLTGWLLLACVVAYATKLVGYLIPPRWLENDRMTRVAGTLTIGLLAALTAMNTFGGSAGPMLDARLGALLVAALALGLRAPFLVVVVAGAAASALLRGFGIG